MKKILSYSFGVLLVVVVALFVFVFFSPRPPLTTDPLTLAGDGSLVDYCDLPELDGSGKRAIDIPKGNTPGCAYEHFPLPILRECTEPLPPGAADIRGLWRGVTGNVGHVERIEQCGTRVVVTAAGIIHDSGPNSTAHSNTDDTEGSVLFTIADQEYCPRTSAGNGLERRRARFSRPGLGAGRRAPVSRWGRARLGIRRWIADPNGAAVSATRRA